MKAVLHTENWLDWECDLDHPIASVDDWVADNASDIALDNVIKDPESPAQWDGNAAPKVLGLIWPTWRSKKNVEKGLMTTTTMETRMNKENKKQWDWMRLCIFTRFCMLSYRELHLENFHTRIVSHHM